MDEIDRPNRPAMKPLLDEVTTQVAAEEAKKQLKAVEKQFLSLEELMTQALNELQETIALMDQIERLK